MEEEIKRLNEMVSVRIEPSKLHGVGIFAIKDIPKGHKLYADNMPHGFTLPYDKFDKLDKEISEILLERWPNVVNGSAFFYPDTRLLAYMNHADKPNYDAINDITLKKIKKGEEVTEDYRKIKGWEKVFTWLKK